MSLLITFDSAVPVTLDAEILSDEHWFSIHASSVMLTLGILSPADTTVLLVRHSGDPQKELRILPKDFQLGLSVWCKNPSRGFLGWSKCVGCHLGKVGEVVVERKGSTNKKPVRTKVAVVNGGRCSAVTELKELGPFITSDLINDAKIAKTNEGDMLSDRLQRTYSNLKEENYVLLAHKDLFTQLSQVLFSSCVSQR